MPIVCPICQSIARLMATHPEANIYRCERCTHAFSDIASMLNQEPYGNDYYDGVHRRWFQHPNFSLFNRIAAIVPRGGALLDIGCGRGDFLRHVRNIRPDVKLTGFDYSRNDDDTIHFLQGDAFQLEISEQFDVVVSLAVIEHVPDCVAFIERMREWTKPGGTIAIMTVNESSLLYGFARVGRWLGVPLAFNRLYSRHHIHHFTLTSLRGLLTKNGLEASQHIIHNAPVKAVDLPVRNPVVDAVLRGIVMALSGAGYILSKSYLQTVIAPVAKDGGGSKPHCPA